MFWTAILLALSFCTTVCDASGAAMAVSTSKPSKAITLNAFVEKALAQGYTGRLPGTISELIGLSKDTPYRSVSLSSDQAADSMGHGFMVMVDESSGAAIIPFSLALTTNYEWPGNRENYWFRASLNGKIERVVVIQGKRDEQGKAIKGSGTTIEKGINSPEIKERFQHELDLWLKKTYLKKEWRSAQFSQGTLKKAK